MISHLWVGRSVKIQNGPHGPFCEKCKTDHKTFDNVWNGQTYKVKRVHKIVESTGIFDLESEDDGSTRRRHHVFLPAFHDRKLEDRDLLKNGVNLFTFAYAATCHKLQGSQYGHVFVIDNPVMEPQRWRYTAFTRAEHKLTVARYA